MCDLGAGTPDFRFNVLDIASVDPNRLDQMHLTWIEVAYRRQLELSGAAGPDDSSDDAVQSDLRARLERALSQLSDIQRQVVLLHDLEGLKHREIAERFEISEGMSRQHVFNARKTLREILGPTALKEHLHE